MYEAKNGGLYSKQNFLLHTMETLVAGDRVFIGNQPDDFGIAGALTSGNRVLMLGLGYGGSLRPLIAGINDIDLVALDCDQNKIQVSSALMSDFFPSISNKVKYVLGDAANFINYVSSTFDVICVDVYSHSGYVDFVFEEAFWNQIKQALSPNGIVIFNAMGLPEHLYPLEGSTPQTRMIQMMRCSLNHVYALPYRRSIILIGSQVEPEAKKVNSTYELRGLDRIIMDLFPLRWKLAKKVDVPIKSGRYLSYVSGELSEIDAEMERRWPDLIKIINKALRACGYSGVDDYSLQKLVYDPIRAQAVTEWLLLQNAKEASFVPIAVGAFAFLQPRGLEWYADWLLENGKRLMRQNEAWFINIALWQLLALVTNPCAHYKHLNGKVKEIVDKLNLYQSV